MTISGSREALFSHLCFGLLVVVAAVYGAVLEDHPEAATCPECSGTDSNGYASKHLCNSIIV